eukprot:531622_1
MSKISIKYEIYSIAKSMKTIQFEKTEKYKHSESLNEDQDGVWIAIVFANQICLTETGTNSQTQEFGMKCLSDADITVMDKDYHNIVHKHIHKQFKFFGYVVHKGD